MQCFCEQDDFIDQTTELPDRKLRNAEGKEVFVDSAVRVPPIRHFPLESVNRASLELVAGHAGRWPSKAKLMQRQTVVALPISELVLTMLLLAPLLRLIHWPLLLVAQVRLQVGK